LRAVAVSLFCKHICRIFQGCNAEDCLYATALALVKGMAYIRIDKRYYISEAALKKFLNQDSAVEITTET